MNSNGNQQPLHGPGFLQSKPVSINKALPRVLMVDDELSVLLGMRRVLRGRYDLTIMESPAEALRMLEHDAGFAVIVSDYHMPTMTGAEFLAAALRLAPDAVRVLLTGSSDLSTAVDAINVGRVFRFIAKPIHPDELRTTIDAACDEFSAAARDRNELRDIRTMREADAEVTADRRTEIEQAIDGGITPHFQPIVHLSGRAVVGHEALSRFGGDPKRTPDRWFDEAAALGMGVELDTAAMCTALDTWRSRGPVSQSLWINLSPETILSGAAHAALVAADHDVVLEITERTPVDDYDRLREALRPLRAKGISLAIDDVGAGYSSLLHVTELRPDIVKLDRSIISALSTDANRQALVSSLIAFAKASGFAPLGEGVETSEEAETLELLGAELGQGYHFGRPAPTPVERLVSVDNKTVSTSTRASTLPCRSRQ